MISAAYIRTTRRTYALWPAAAAFVAGLAIGMLLGMQAGYRDRQAKELGVQFKLIRKCADGVAVTLWTERGPIDQCIFGSNRMGARGD